MLVEAVGPGRHRPLQEVLVGAQAELEHPLRLVLEGADLLDRLARQAALGLVQVDEVVVEGVFGAAIADLGLCDHDAPVGWHDDRWGSAGTVLNPDSHYRN